MLGRGFLLVVFISIIGAKKLLIETKGQSLGFALYYIVLYRSVLYCTVLHLVGINLFLPILLRFGREIYG